MLDALKGAAVLALLGFLAPGLAGCSVGEGHLGREVVSRAKNGTGTIRLEELTPFRWDRVCFFAPYTNQGPAEACLGFPWPGFKSTEIELEDSFSLMVFALEGKVVHVERISRRVDFAASILERPFTPPDAVLKPVRTASGRTELAQAGFTGV